MSTLVIVLVAPFGLPIQCIGPEIPHAFMMVDSTLVSFQSEVSQDLILTISIILILRPVHTLSSFWNLPRNILVLCSLHISQRVKCENIYQMRLIIRFWKGLFDRLKSVYSGLCLTRSGCLKFIALWSHIPVANRHTSRRWLIVSLPFHIGNIGKAPPYLSF